MGIEAEINLFAWPSKDIQWKTDVIKMETTITFILKKIENLLWIFAEKSIAMNW